MTLNGGIVRTQIDPIRVKGVNKMFPNIDAERARMGLSRAALAAMLGVSYSTMKNWMRGTTDIPASKITEMSKLFHCTTDYLLGLNTGQNKK